MSFPASLNHDGRKRLARFITALALLLCAIGGAAPAQAISITIGPAGLALSPGGPYSEARNKPVGSVIATADVPIAASGITNTCLVTALMLSGSPAVGNTFTTGIAGLGVNLYYYNGGTRLQIAPGLQASIALTLAAPGTLTTIEAQLVVTGPIASGSLTALPNLNLTFLAVGLGCGLLNLSNQTLTVTASSGIVNTLTCVVTNPAITVNLPNVSRFALATAGNVAGATRFTIPLNCASVGANVYVTLTDATNIANVTSLLTLKASSTATNVRLQLLQANGNLISYGPDAATAGNFNQWSVGPSASISGIPLIAQYYSTGGTTAGSVQAIATFTLSYQ